jgi:hypothetical protein
MLRCVLGALGLALAFDLGRGLALFFNPSAVVGVPFVLVGWPVLCFGGLTAGANLGSLLDRLLAVQDRSPPATARNRRWLVRCLGLIQCTLSAALIVILTSILPSTPISRLWTGFVAVRPALVLVGAGVVWLLLLKGWFEVFTGVRFREWHSWWRSLSLWSKLTWAGGFYGFGIPLTLIPTLLLMRLVTS